MHSVNDREILARYRTKHAHPYMPLSMAKAMHRLECKYAHLGVAHAKGQRDRAVSVAVRGEQAGPAAS